MILGKNYVLYKCYSGAIGYEKAPQSQELGTT